MNSDLSLPSLENGYLPLNAYLAKGRDPVVQTIADDLLRRMRTAFAYYRRWYSETPYGRMNPLTDHLYSEKTWSELTSAFPELLRGDEAAYLGILDKCSKADAVYYSVVAHRFLGNWYEGKNRLQEAEETYRLALAQAQEARLETEIGHLLRLYGYALRKKGELNEAERIFRRAVSYESNPECIYWQALSVRELSDVLIRKLPSVMDPKNPPEELGTVLEAYRVGRSLFESHVASGVIPVARAAKQQLFRSYVDNAMQLAILSGGPDSVAEIDAAGPRYATDVVAESRAAVALGADSYTKYLQGRAAFHSVFATFSPMTDLADDFRNYVASLAPNREARQFYMKTRVALTAPITHAQLSDELAARFFKQKIPDVIFMMFHIARTDTFMTVVDRDRGLSTLGKVTVPGEDWKKYNAAFQTALRRASSGPLPHPEMMREAIDVLLAKYESSFSSPLEAYLPLLQGKQLKVFPRFSMNAVPFHALKVKGVPLIEHCDVSYGQTLGMFFQVHREAAPADGARLGVVYDDQGTVAYRGTFRMLEAAGIRGLSMLPNNSWSDLRRAIHQQKPSDLFFACHGKYEVDNPTRSKLHLRGDNELLFSEMFSDMDLSGCRSVTIGACESGLARTLVSAEYIGLPVAFFAAGARYVIGTLWEVNQIAAAILLGHHLRFLAGGKHTVVAALNKAQRATMKMTRAAVVNWLNDFVPEKAKAWEPLVRRMDDLPFAHPYYWGGFYVAGDV
jgi:tetratricopeptide (TPR) repeat protein